MLRRPLRLSILTIHCAGRSSSWSLIATIGARIVSTSTTPPGVCARFLRAGRPWWLPIRLWLWLPAGAGSATRTCWSWPTCWRRIDEEATRGV